MYKLLKIVLVFFISFSIACNRNDTEFVKNIDTTIEEPINYYDSHYVGLVSNENEEAIDNAIITISSKRVTTTSTGAFVLTQVKTNNAGSIIEIKKSGYYNAYEFVLNAEQSISNLNVKLKAKRIHSRFNNANDQVIVMDNGISLKIPSNAFIDGTSSPYIGQVTFYINTDLKTLSKMPFLSNELKSYILQEPRVVQFYAEDESGQALQLAKPISVISADVNTTIGQLDLEKERWQELEGIKKSASENIVNATNFEPIVIGRPVSKTLISTKLVTSSNLPTVFLRAEISDSENNIYYSNISQDGTLQFYMPKNKSISIVIKDECGNTIKSTSYKSEIKNKETIANIVLSESYFKTLTSQITTCKDMLSLNDMVYVIYDFAGYKKIGLQAANKLEVSMPACLYLQKASYYRGDQKIYSIALDQSVNNENNIFLGSNLFCVPKLSGFIKINDASILLNSDQYKIFRDGSTSNLTVTNFNGFVISIDNVVQKGTYSANGIVFNNPAYADCFGKDCNGIVIEVNAIGNLGEIVSLKVKGKLNGLPIDGEFNNRLSN